MILLLSLPLVTPGQAHSWGTTDSWHQKAAALHHNWPAVLILVHHMTLISSSYPHSQCDITASQGWCGNVKRFSVLKTLSFVLLPPVTGQMKQKLIGCRRCRCTRTAARGFCGCLTAGPADAHWTGLTLFCWPWWLFLPLVRVISTATRVQSGLWTGLSGAKFKDFI